jgi:para-aminobenzoate synthetase component 1
MEPTELPIIHEVRPLPDAEEAFLRIARSPHCVFFDSARRDPALGRYSFLAADPFDYFELPADGSDGIQKLSERLKPFESTRLAELPPFQGGAAGLFSYDLGRAFERLPTPAYDEFTAPAAAVGLYDVVLAIDHVAGRAWIISQGFPETNPRSRQQRARDRLKEFLAWLNEPRSQHSPINASQADILPADALAPQHVISGFPGLTSNFSRTGYLAAVERAIEYIRAGDIFQSRDVCRVFRHGPISDL